MNRTNSEIELKELMNKKWALMILNVLTFFVALGIFGVCIWIRFDLDFREWVREIDW